MATVSYHSIQFKYTGRFENYTQEELGQIALAKLNSGDFDTFDYSREVDEKTARRIDHDWYVENEHPCNKSARFHWIRREA